jgi:hypothetical protein
LPDRAVGRGEFGRHIFEMKEKVPFTRRILLCQAEKFLELVRNPAIRYRLSIGAGRATCDDLLLAVRAFVCGS